MKTNRIFTIALAAVITGVTLTGCGSSKPSIQSGSTAVSVPLSGDKYRSDKDYFRASQSGQSIDLATAKKIALQNAKTELAGSVQTVIKAVTENYTNQRAMGNKQEFENKFEENARAVINQTLNNVKIIGEETYKEADGKITYYIAVEMSCEDLYNSVCNGISKDARLQIDFDQAQFKKTYDEEMSKFENR